MFAAVGLALIGWTIAMCLLEPILFDGWFIEQWLAQGGSFTEYVRANWMGDLTWGNPRIGQWITYATYDIAWHVVLTPLIVLALFALLLVHLRGRWPDPARDGRVLLLLVGLAVLGQPQLGPVLFYRPFTANYVVGLVVQLAWLIPYRFALERVPGAVIDRRLAIPKALGMLVLGAIAGACNEHTGPALVAATGVACMWLARKRSLRVWLVVGLVAFVAGYLAMMTAPAQATRYCGVGEGSLVERITGRSLVGTLQIVFGLLLRGKWMWIGLALAWIAVRTRPQRLRPALLWIALGAAISLTLLLSPKLGDRLLFAGLAFASLGVALIVEDLAVDRPRLRTAITLVTVGALGFGLARSLAVGAHVAADDTTRRARLAAAERGSIVKVQPHREPRSQWFVGDDFTMDSLRHHVAQMYGVHAIDVAGRLAIPYQFAIRYDAGTGARAVDRFISLNQCEARRTFGDEVTALRGRIGASLVSAELAIVPREPVFDGKPLASSRWRDGRLVAPNASVVNEMGTRYITVDRGGLEGAFELTLVGPGRVLKLGEEAGRFPYKPWVNGTYWAIVCAGADCYLASTIHHRGL